VVRFKDALDLTRAAALAAGFFLLGGVLPVLGAPVMLCAPAPILIHSLGHQRSYWRVAVILALTLIAIGLIAGPVQGLSFALSLGVATVLIAIAIRGRWSFELIVFAGTAAMLAAATVALLIWTGSPAALARLLDKSIAAALSQSASLYEKLGMSKADSKQISDRVLDVTSQLVPALAAMLGALTVLINLGLVARWLGAEKIGYPLFGDLVTWRTPEWLIWLLPADLACSSLWQGRGLQRLMALSW
jgi:uncharacterized protein YybS (DUF2232 family)